MKRQSRWEFHKYVLEKGVDECWPWQSALSEDGHPRFGAEGTQWWVHRLVYEERYSAIPDYPERLVMHLCNNSKCCNPNHLFLGTAADNMAHAGLTGTLSRKGSANGNSKLTTQQAEAIRSDPRPSRAVAKLYGLEKTQVLRIRRGDHWK